MPVKKKPEAKATENTEALLNVAEEEVNEPVENNEDIPEEEIMDGETVEETGITVDPEPTPEPVIESKKVKIKPNCNYRFYYGTTWYTLCKDVVMTVPVEVKDRLQSAGKLSAL